MKALINGAVKLFSFGVSAFLILTLIATALVIGAWCIAWTLLSNLSN